jgi:hypothetical protein
MHVHLEGKSPLSFHVSSRRFQDPLADAFIAIGSPNPAYNPHPFKG